MKDYGKVLREGPFSHQNVIEVERPNGMTDAQRLVPIENAVFALSFTSSLSCQYPDFRSRVNSELAPAESAFTESSIHGRGY